MKKFGIIGAIVGGVILLAGGAAAIIFNKKDDDAAQLEEGNTLEVEYEETNDSVEDAE